MAVFAAVLGLGVGNPPVDRYRVVNGDTLDRLPARCWLSNLGLTCRPHRFRLDGIEAFRSDQTCIDASNVVWPCGTASVDRLRKLSERADFLCLVDEASADRRARLFGVCSAEGRDVATTLVEEGLAFAFGRRSRYADIEGEARKLHSGAWAGSFIRPQYFRFLPQSGSESAS